jgi:hypothetical protein
MHHNSTITSKACYLIAEGGIFDGYTIAGVGTGKLERILYRAVTSYYSSNANFNEAYFDILQAATDLYGPNDVAQVQNALRAVEIDHVRPTIPASEVIDRHLFYNNSAFDTASDDAAIATDKRALLPGQTASFANYTNYNRGINGLMIDVAHMVNYTSSLTTADFNFQTSTDGIHWTTAPAPQSISFDGKEGRVKIIWADNAIQNCWLQVTLKANANTGLTQDDVFSSSNVIGETGNNTAEPAPDSIVNASDAAAILANYTATAGITNPYDLNRDGAVDAADLAIVEASHSPGLTLFRTLAAAAASWTSSGLILKLTGDGMLHLLDSNTLTDAVAPQVFSSLLNVAVTGRDNVADTLTIDFSGGNPLPEVASPTTAARAAAPMR